MAKQRYTSAETDLKQVPAVWKILLKYLEKPALYFVRNDECLDYGGGAGDKLSDEMAKFGVRNYVLDPYNRSEEHNTLVRRLLGVRPASFAICSNVLNVIKEPAVRMEVLREIAELTDPLGNVYISVYEGDKSSRGRKTAKGWQNNRPLKSYVKEIRKVFGSGFYLPGNKVLVCEGRREHKRGAA